MINRISTISCQHGITCSLMFVDFRLTIIQFSLAPSFHRSRHGRHCGAPIRVGSANRPHRLKKNLGSGNYTSNVEGINIHCFFASKMRASNNQCWIEGIIYGKLPGCYMFLLLNTGVSCRFSQRRLGQCRNWCANLLTTSTAWNLWLSPSSRVLALYMSTYNHVYVRMCIYVSLCICVHVGMYTHIYIN